jgi:exodeoxyribonuclease VII large subunit
VRAAARSAIPLISAIGHETDWTLFDHASDRRAPTPTGAAEIAVPVRAELVANLASLAGRLISGALRHVERKRGELHGSARALPGRERLLALPRQRLDAALQARFRAVERQIERRRHRVVELGRRMAGRSPAALLAGMRQRLKGTVRQLPLRQAAGINDRRKHLANAARHLAVVFGALLRRHRDAGALALAKVESLGARQGKCAREMLASRQARLEGLGQLLESVGYRRVLARGYALVHDAAGRPLRAAAEIAPGQALTLEFLDGKVGAFAAGTSLGAKMARKRGLRGEDKAEPSLFE